jgi:hypothetical protein
VGCGILVVSLEVNPPPQKQLNQYSLHKRVVSMVGFSENFFRKFIKAK